jgi:hypothetical protein
VNAPNQWVIQTNCSSLESKESYYVSNYYRSDKSRYDFGMYKRYWEDGF